MQSFSPLLRRSPFFVRVHLPTPFSAMSLRFATSRRLDMRPLTFQGIGVPFSYEQLRLFLLQNEEKLAARGMPAASRLLAEPVHDPSGITDWHVQGSARPVPLADLPPETQRVLLSRLDGYRLALDCLLAEQSHEPGDPLPGLLRLALEHPSRADIYALEGRPLLINWGFAPGEALPEPEDIARSSFRPRGVVPEKSSSPGSAHPEPSPGAEEFQAPRTFPGPETFSPRKAGRGSPAVPPAEPSSPAPAGKTAVTDAGPAGGQVPGAGSPPRPQATAGSGKEEKDPAPKRLSRRRTGLAVLAGLLALALILAAARHFSEAPPGRQPAPRAPIAASPKAPAKEEARHSLADFAGCWRNEPELSSSEGEKVTVRFCFDAGGRGEQIIREESGRLCKGPARAALEREILTLRGEKAPCADGSGYREMALACQAVGEDIWCTWDNGRDVSRDRFFRE